MSDGIKIKLFLILLLVVAPFGSSIMVMDDSDAITTTASNDTLTSYEDYTKTISVNGMCFALGDAPDPCDIDVVEKYCDEPFLRFNDDGPTKIRYTRNPGLIGLLNRRRFHARHTANAVIERSRSRT